MIDIRNEQVLSLSEACKVLPKLRGGKRPHLATLYRWSLAGIRGTVLETVQVGGTRCTSLEAIERFVAKLSNGGQLGRPVSSATARRRAADICDDAGIG